MADNYLENKMAEHMAGKRIVRRHASGPIRFNPLRVVVAGCLHDIAVAAAARFIAAGCRVACLGCCEAPGARNFPAEATCAEAMARLIHDWHEIDLLLLAGDAPGVAAAVAEAKESVPAPLRVSGFRTIAIDTDCPAGAVRLDTGGTDAAAIAGLCLLLAAPDAAPLFAGACACKRL